MTKCISQAFSSISAVFYTLKVEVPNSCNSGKHKNNKCGIKKMQYAEAGWVKCFEADNVSL